MDEKKLSLFVGVNEVQQDLCVSKSKAYDIISKLNVDMKAANPRAIVLQGKVNRFWYNEACLMERVV